jgi:hypothetical protein
MNLTINKSFLLILFILTNVFFTSYLLDFNKINTNYLINIFLFFISIYALLKKGFTINKRYILLIFILIIHSSLILIFQIESFSIKFLFSIFYFISIIFFISYLHPVNRFFNDKLILNISHIILSIIIFGCFFEFLFSDLEIFAQKQNYHILNNSYSGFFSEPSKVATAAILFLNFFLFRKKYKFYICYLSIFILLVNSFSLVIFSILSIIVFIFCNKTYWHFLLFIPPLILIILTNDFLFLRLSSLTNFDHPSILQLLNSYSYSLNKLFSLGDGLNSMNITFANNQTSFSLLLEEKLQRLNSNDGTAILPKLLAEFGFLGFLFFTYVFYLLFIFFKKINLRRNNLNESDIYVFVIFFTSIMIFAIRSSGYFTEISFYLFFLIIPYIKFSVIKNL